MASEIMKTTDKTPAGNSGFKKLAVQWLIEHFTSHQHLWRLDNFVLRNRQLLKPANRYAFMLKKTGDTRKSFKE